MVALIIIGSTLSALWVYGRSQNFLVCDMDCGETVLSVHAANQFAAHGVQYGLLENLGGLDEPKIYTHNVNIGAITFIALEALGIRSFALKELLPLAVFGLGLFYVYLSVQLFTGSILAAITTLIVFATAYWGLGAFAFNALRAWHMLAFFAVAYHVSKLSSPAQTRKRRTHFFALGVAACVTFGCGYDFWFPCGCVAVALASFDWLEAPGYLNVARLGKIAAVFALPFFLRQLQVMYVLGINYWLHDLIFSVAIKIPYAGQIIGIPSISAIDSFYQAYHVLRPPALPSNDIGEILYTAQHMITAITIPRWGIVTILTFAFAVCYSIVLRIGVRPLHVVVPHAVSAGLSGALLPMTIGIAIGLAAFAPFSLHVYVKHEFPLVAFPILLAKGLVIYWLVWSAVEHRRTALRGFAALATTVYVGDAAMVHINNNDHGLYANFGWRKFVQNHPNAQFMLSTYRIFTNNRMLGEMASLLGLTHVRFSYANSADAIRAATDARLSHIEDSTFRTTYWIYQPADHANNFDAPYPSCRWNDWILGHTAHAFSKRGDAAIFTLPWIVPARPAVGTTLSFGGRLDGFNNERDTLKVRLPPGVSLIDTPIYNCIYATWIAWAKITHVMPQPLTIDVFDVQGNGAGKLLYKFTEPVANATRRSQPIGMPASPDPPIEAVIAAFPNYRVVARDDQGIGYVIFEVPKKP